MAYDDQDAARDEFIERFTDEVIGEFTAEKLRSYYVENPKLLVPALDAMAESRALSAHKHHAAAIVFAATAMEQLFKVAMLRPLVFGLVHHDALATVIMDRIVSPQLRFDEYKRLLSRIYQEILGSNADELQTKAGKKGLLDQCDKTVQKRNAIVHRADSATPEEARLAMDQVADVFDVFVRPVIEKLGLQLDGLSIVRARL